MKELKDLAIQLFKMRAYVCKLEVDWQEYQTLLQEIETEYKSTIFYQSITSLSFSVNIHGIKINISCSNVLVEK